MWYQSQQKRRYGTVLLLHEDANGRRLFLGHARRKSKHWKLRNFLRKILGKFHKQNSINKHAADLTRLMWFWNIFQIYSSFQSACDTVGPLSKYGIGPNLEASWSTFLNEVSLSCREGRTGNKFRLRIWMMCRCDSIHSFICLMYQVSDPFW